MNKNAIDQNILQGIRDLGEDDLTFLPHYLNLFLAPLAGKIQQMEIAIMTLNFKSLQDEAHALKSSAANTGALSFSELAAQLEALGKKQSMENAIAILEQLKTEWIQVKKELEPLLK